MSIDATSPILGESSQTANLRAWIRTLAPSEVRVLILGENGTGKELIASEIHRLSHRSAFPFVTLNCGAVPEALFESELFGHERGSFTGAESRRLGRIELAEGGTLFLDEIGDLPLPMQVKLLRVLQEGTYARVGGQETLSSNVRVLAATNKDLKQAVAEGTFREDLYYRLAGFPLTSPPLRTRTEDLRPIIAALLKRSSRPTLRLTDEAFTTLARYQWPGNVRELGNIVDRLVLLAPSSEVSKETTQAALSLDNGGALPALRLPLLQDTLRTSVPSDIKSPEILDDSGLPIDEWAFPSEPGAIETSSTTLMLLEPGSTKNVKWRHDLAQAVCSVFDCALEMQENYTTYAKGTSSAVRQAAKVYLHLRRKVDEEYDRSRPEVTNRSLGRTFAHAFRIGMSSCLVARLDARGGTVSLDDVNAEHAFALGWTAGNDVDLRDLNLQPAKTSAPLDNVQELSQKQVVHKDGRVGVCTHEDEDFIEVAVDNGVEVLLREHLA